MILVTNIRYDHINDDDPSSNSHLGTPHPGLPRIVNHSPCCIPQPEFIKTIFMLDNVLAMRIIMVIVTVMMIIVVVMMMMMMMMMNMLRI